MKNSTTFYNSNDFNQDDINPMIEIENYGEGADNLNMFDIPLDPN